MEAKDETLQVSVTIETGLLERIDAAAARNRRSRSAEIAFRVERSLDADDMANA